MEIDEGELKTQLGNLYDETINNPENFQQILESKSITATVNGKEKIMSLTGVMAKKFDTTEETIIYLDKIGNPPIISNDLNIMLFYQGEKAPITLRLPYICNEQNFKDMKKYNIYLVYNGEVDENNNLILPRDNKGVPYFCDLFEKIKFEEIKEFSPNLRLFKLA